MLLPEMLQITAVPNTGRGFVHIEVPIKGLTWRKIYDAFAKELNTDPEYVRLIKSGSGIYNSDELVDDAALDFFREDGQLHVLVVPKMPFSSGAGHKYAAPASQLFVSTKPGYYTSPAMERPVSGTIDITGVSRGHGFVNIKVPVTDLTWRTVYDAFAKQISTDPEYVTLVANGSVFHNSDELVDADALEFFTDGGRLNILVRETPRVSGGGRRRSGLRSRRSARKSSRRSSRKSSRRSSRRSYRKSYRRSYRKSSRK